MSIYSGVLLTANKASTTLAGSITSTATTANLAAGAGVEFPSPGAGQYFTGTLNDAATGLLFEIVYVTNVTGDLITMVRGQEGTDALNWNAGDLFFNGVTAGTIQVMAQTIEVQAGQMSYAADAGSVNAISVTLSPAPVSMASLIGAPIRVKIGTTTTSTTPTLTVNGFTAATIKNGNGSALSVGQLTAGAIITFEFDGTYAQVASASNVVAPVIAQPLQGNFKNLKIVTTSNTARTITADALEVQDGSGSVTRLLTVNVSYSTGTVGANGIDSGTPPASGLLYDYVIYDPAATTVAALCSESATAPTLPSGYTQFARVGACPCDGSADLYRVKQAGRRAQFTVTPATNTASQPLLASGMQGSGAATSPVYASASVASLVPATASRIQLLVADNEVSTDIAAAPNTSYGGLGSDSAPPPINTFGSGALNMFSQLGEFGLESTDIAIWSSGSNAYWFVTGWEDNL